MTIADICFVCDLALIASEASYERVLFAAALEPIVQPSLAFSYPRTFQHFRDLRHHPAFEPDFASYGERLGGPPFTINDLFQGETATSLVRLMLDGLIATVTLSNPGGNRINFQMREEMLDAIGRVAASQARVLLVKGDGNDFCLGGDIRDWPGIPSTELRPRVEVYAKAIDVLESLSIPTVAVVRGGCMGGGFELAMGCDLIVAAKSARFMFPEAMLGIMTLRGGVYQLAERIGRNKELELVMLSTPVDASQMEEWNVVNMVAEDGELEAASAELARRLAAGPAKAYAGIKALMKIWRDDGHPAAREALNDISMPLFDTPDVQLALRQAVAALNEGHSIPRASFPTV